MRLKIKPTLSAFGRPLYPCHTTWICGLRVLTDAERHCRLDSFAFDDQANAALKVDDRTETHWWLASQSEYIYLVRQFALICHVAFASSK